jgi:hypothetical protein
MLPPAPATVVDHHPAAPARWDRRCAHDPADHVRRASGRIRHHQLDGVVGPGRQRGGGQQGSGDEGGAQAAAQDLGHGVSPVLVLGYGFPVWSVRARKARGTRSRYLLNTKYVAVRLAESRRCTFPPEPAMTATPRLQGIFSPVLTPFNADYTPDPDRFIRHCRWLLDQGRRPGRLRHQLRGQLADRSREACLARRAAGSRPAGRAHDAGHRRLRLARCHRVDQAGRERRLRRAC